MKIGDTIRFIHSKGEGIIKKVIDEKTFEVEIEDGFRIPVLRNEIVVVAKEENTRFKASTPTTSDSNFANSKDKDYGVYLAFSPFNDRVYSFILINNTPNIVLYSLGEKSVNSYEGISSGILLPKGFEKIKELKIADFESWPEFNVQMLFHRQGHSEKFSPIDKKIKFKASTFYKSKKYNAILEKEVFQYQIDQGLNLKPEDVQSFFSPQQSSSPVIELSKPNEEVDLHIEKINPSYKTLKSEEILQHQLTYFEKQLENAIAAGMKEIIFIHGTGNGTLKNKIHKKLSENIFIKYFEDARKEKFGYGATLVKIK